MNNSQKELRELTLEECEKISGGCCVVAYPRRCGCYQRPRPRPQCPPRRRDNWVAA